MGESAHFLELWTVRKQIWPKVLFAKFGTFKKCESSQIELLSGKSNFRGAKICWPKFANRTFQRKIILWPKVLFPNFRTFQKCESSSIELLSEKPNFRGAKNFWPKFANRTFERKIELWTVLFFGPPKVRSSPPPLYPLPTPKTTTGSFGCFTQYPLQTPKTTSGSLGYFRCIRYQLPKLHLGQIWTQYGPDMARNVYDMGRGYS